MHRDVKAENIGLSHALPNDQSCITSSCRVKLIDFDSAAMVPQHGSLTEVIGTVENMAPEVFEASYDERADCWSLGVVCHQLLFGYRPFNDVSVEGIEEMVRNWRQYLHLSTESTDEPTEFIRSLLVDRTDRPSSSDALQLPWIAHSRVASAEAGICGHLHDQEQVDSGCTVISPKVQRLQATEKKDIRCLTAPSAIPSPARNRCSNVFLPTPQVNAASACSGTLEDSVIAAAVSHEDELGHCLDRIRNLIKELEKNAADTAAICSLSRPEQLR